MKRDISYGCIGSTSEKDFKLYNESLITWDFYDDGTAESTANITITGAYVKASLKFEANDNACIGNPGFYDPAKDEYAISLCFNETTAGDFEYAKPKNYVATYSAPEVLNGKNVIGGKCYVIDVAPI